MRTLLAIGLITTCLVAAGCIGASGSAVSSDDHGGYTGQAAHYYDVAYKSCRKQTVSYVASGRDPGSIMYVPIAPAAYLPATKAGCEAGRESAMALGTCTHNATSNPDTTSQLRCTYPSTRQP